ncbi:MAG: hypothetical protein KDD34_06795 [Bdellovibrionales bacterium]|nr:hypothetical protein [Bdellovibrionales bacterium]
MKRTFIFYAFACFTLFGCEKQNKSGQTFMIPWPNEQSFEALQPVSIPTLNSPYVVSGPIAKVYSDQGLTFSGFSGDPVRPQLTLVGDVFYPLDVKSSMALAIYAHFERLFELDQQLGIQSQLPWPRRVGFDIPLVDSITGQQSENNAHYLPDRDIIVFLPTNSQKLPMPINPGVIAHEHFHAHFNFLLGKSFLNKTYQSNIEEYNVEILLRGWNEGLADYYALVYSQQPEFLGASLGDFWNQARSLKTPIQNIKNSQYYFNKFEKGLSQNQVPLYLVYNIGTDLARTLVHIVEQQDEKSKIRNHKEMIRWIVSALPQYQQIFSEKNNKEMIEPVDLLRFFFLENNKVLSMKQCEALVKVAPQILLKDESLENQCL